MTLLDDMIADPVVFMISIVFSIIVTFLPIIVLGIPELIFRFYRKRGQGVRIYQAIYSRFYLGFIIFWVLYYLIPAFLNFLVPNEQAFSQAQVYHYPSDPRYHGPKIFSTIWNPDDYDFLKYVGQLIATSVILYLQYPVLILPPVFVVGPILAFLILLIQVYQRTRDTNLVNMKTTTEAKDNQATTTSSNQHAVEYDENDPNAPLMDTTAIRDAQARMRKVETLGENLEQLSYELPREKVLNEIIDRIQARDFQKEKELFQIIMAVLPISLFLLMSLLKILGQVENPTILQGTPMGWFLEIFFVYLATIVFSVYLLKACNFSLKGDPGISSRLYQSMYQSLVTVGAFMSVIASILFLIEFPDQIFVVIYFIMYFIMVTLFFVLFLDIFEPVSRYFLYQLLNAMKKSQFVSNAVPTERFLYRMLSPKKWISFLRTIIQAIMQGFIKRLNRTTAKIVTITVAVLIVMSLAEFTAILFFYLLYANFERLHAQSFFSSVTLYLKLIFLSLLALFFRKYNWSVAKNAFFIFITAFIYSSLSAFFFIYLPSNNFLGNETLGIIVGTFMYTPTASGSIPMFYPTFITSMLFIFLGSQGNFWITSVLKFGIFREIYIVIPETFYVESGFTGAGQSLLGILSAPYILFRELTVITFLALFIHLIQVEHTIKTIKHPEKHNILTKTVFSQRGILPTSDALKEQPNSHRLMLTPMGKSREWKILLATLDVLTTHMDHNEEAPITFMNVMQQANETLLRVFNESSEVTIEEFWKAMTVLGNTKPIAKLFHLLDELDHFVDNYKEFFRDRQQFLKYKLKYQPSKHNDSMLKKLQMFVAINKHLLKNSETTPSVQEISESLNLDLVAMRNQLNTLYQKIPGFKRYMIFLGEEFGYSYEEVALDSLHVMMIDGRSIFTFLFREESVVEPALVAGLFAAITSFAQEAVQSKELLRSIDHGDVFLTIEYGQNILAAVFSDKVSSEIRRKLQQFVKEFEQRHASDLKDWLGDQSLFFKDVELVREIFEVEEDVGQLVT